MENNEIIIDLEVCVTNEEINLITEGYQLKDTNTTRIELYNLCRTAIKKKLSKVGRCKCGRVFGKTDKNQIYCSRECAKKADAQSDLPFEGENYEIEER